LQSALAEQKRTGRKLGRVLSDLKLVDEAVVCDALARHLQIPFVDLRTLSIDRAAVKLLPEGLARRFRALVLKVEGGSLMVGMVDPTDLVAYDELAARLRKPLQIVLLKEDDLVKTIDVVYRRTDEIASIAQEVREELISSDIDIEQLAASEGSPDAPVLRLIQSMFQDAVQVRASDIHIEPGEAVLRIRQRVDGVLHEQSLDAQRVAGALVTRLKLMSGLDIAEKRLPQDGRFSLKVGGRSIDVRASTLPTQHGESVVLRLLDQSSSLLSLPQLGMPDGLLARFRELIERSAGMTLVTGPTGSGKTTTLYSALGQLNRADTKIITVEDPVEYRLDRINQVQINPKIGLDFARVLRTTLRQDPDVILIGEMRDRETVDIGLRAAITGHLVLSTLHTINAIATVNRLLDMGAAGYMIAAALDAIVAQRLLRRICDDCREPATPTPQQLAWLHAQIGRARALPDRFSIGHGCAYCNLSGYRGRIAVYELLELDAGLADAIRRQDISAFAQLARAKADYRPLTQAALDLAVEGRTTLAEVISATSGTEERDPQLLADALSEESLRDGEARQVALANGA
ncbi:MAG TPA: GspE/PulE family protein, partial [Steroidobacteraceae bacterium]|nr:GspE/PulE family protein [Steroidobacteraceae bacterium]